MKGSLTVIGFFLLGVLLGYTRCLPEGMLGKRPNLLDFIRFDVSSRHQHWL